MTSIRYRYDINLITIRIQRCNDINSILIRHRCNLLGLCNVPAIFQRLMNQVLRKYLRKFILVYLDDIIIYSKIFKEHKEHVRIVFEALRAASLMMKPKKCKFVQKELW